MLLLLLVLFQASLSTDVPLPVQLARIQEKTADPKAVVIRDFSNVLQGLGRCTESPKALAELALRDAHMRVSSATTFSDSRIAMERSNSTLMNHLIREVPELMADFRQVTRAQARVNSAPQLRSGRRVPPSFCSGPQSHAG